MISPHPHRFKHFCFLVNYLLRTHYVIENYLLHAVKIVLLSQGKLRSTITDSIFM